MSVSMDEINFLVWRYMQENGFPHAAFVFETESLADTTNITTAQIPPGALISLLQKSIVYLNLEKSIRMAKQDPDSTIASEIEKINQAFPNPSHENKLKEESFAGQVSKLTEANATFLRNNNCPTDNFEWSPDGRKLATLDSDNVLKIHTLKENGQFDTLIFPSIPPSSTPRSPTTLSWNSTSDLLAVASDVQANVVSLDGKIKFTVTGGVSSVKFSLSQSFLVTCSRQDYNIALWEIRDGQASQLESYTGSHGLVYDVCWRDDGVFATASHDKCVTTCSISGNRQVMHGHLAPVTSVAFNVHKSLLASGSDDGSIIIWKDGRNFKALKGHSAGITAIKWHPVMPNTLFSASLDGTVKMWDTLNGECAQTFAHHANGITSIDIHPSGRILATGGNDGIFAIWGISSNPASSSSSAAPLSTTDVNAFSDVQILAAFTNDANVIKLSFSPTGEFLAVSFEAPNVAVVSVGPFLI
ncbi:WD repeat protein [Tritrichomonas foetus]|uniref:WD repeat protein n=1 Tax=Tritrichomonas foetus TaxID=1144522 RepID=A0A1J4K9U4_9EUKA|nr:WD repeat protein [Tritrichomonas foetus]|eukprot:OHT06414.1 WD repeat protein [Tritrichomonas foetus]